VTDAGAGAPPPLPERARYQPTEQTRTYPCGNCGGQLVFDPALQKLKCPDCGNVQDIIEDAGRATAEQDFHAAVARLREQAGAGAQVAGEKEVVCQNCGGHTTFTGTLAATRCPYCATPIQRDDVHDAPARLPVDGVLPFQVAERAARDSLEKWIDSRWFAPSEFKKYNQKGSFASVYASYFTYDAETDTWYEGRRGEEYTVTVGEGDKRRTETRVNWYPASGEVHNSFDDIAVLANTGFDHGKVTALEPWPTQQARPFSAEYIAGHLCRTYDRDVEACLGEARQRMDAVIDSTVRADIGGDRQDIHRKETTVQALTFKHLLLPIWLLTVIYAGRPFQVFINGITGEVQGERPWSRVKIAVAVVIAVVVAVIVAVVWQSAGGESQP
jgi:DNA-directed RNA polymerase subunit RPC12/RpoP